MIHIPTASRVDLEVEILTNEELYIHLELIKGSVEDWALEASTEELRESLTEWVLENNEATCE